MKIPSNPDPIAAFAGAALILAGIFGAAESLGITADQLAEGIGAIAMVAATIRTIITKRKAE